MRKLGIIALLLSVLCLGLSATTPEQNIGLHEIGTMDSVTVYKMVHYGCEIFVAKGSRGNSGEIVRENPTPVAIATGRGCK